MTVYPGERTFQRPETISINAEIKDWTGAFVTPDQDVKMTLTNPSGTVILTDVVMTATATGKYVYYYTSAVGDVVGWWKTVVTIQDGTGAGAKYTVSHGGFYLQ